MPNQVPVSVNFGTLPQTGQGYTPQQLADTLSANAKIFSEQQMALFTTGTTAPTSNIGPWLKNGTTWYVWDSVTGAYIPEVMAQQSLQFIVSSATPDPTKYQVWYKTDVSGVPQGTFIYTGGVWTDMYGVALKNLFVKNYPVRAASSVPQTGVPANNTHTKVINLTGIIDPDSAWTGGTTSRYTAAVNGIYLISVKSQVDNNTATASGMQIGYDIYLNGSPWAGTGTGTMIAIASPPGGRWYPTVTTMVPLNAGQYIELDIIAYDGIGTGNVTITTVDFMISLIRQTP